MYELRWTRKAEKQLMKIDRTHRERLIALADTLCEDPFQKNSKKMKGADIDYRIRQGNYRIVYSVYKEQLIVKIVKVGHRQGVYK